MSERYAELREADRLRRERNPNDWMSGDGAPFKGTWVMHRPGGFGTHIASLGDDFGAEEDARLIVLAVNSVATLLAERDALVEALRLAHDVIRRTRDHLSTDHPDCAYAVLGIFNDARVRVLLGAGVPDPDPAIAAWNAGLDQPTFRAALDRGLADVEAGRTKRLFEVLERALGCLPPQETP